MPNYHQHIVDQALLVMHDITVWLLDTLGDYLDLVIMYKGHDWGI